MKALLDTNVLVYAVDRTDAKKNARAVSVVQSALRGTRDYAVSAQSLSEFANVAFRKLALPADSILEFLRVFKGLTTILPDNEVISRSVEIKALYGLQFYDATLVAAAERAGAREIWSEDLNPGQRYGGILAVNPF